MAHRDIVVMGASPGGAEAPGEVLRGLPADLPRVRCRVGHADTAEMVGVQDDGRRAIGGPAALEENATLDDTARRPVPSTQHADRIPKVLTGKAPEE